MIAEAGLTQWQVAFKAGISAQTLSNWLRLPLSDDQRERVITAIDELKGGITTCLKQKSRQFPGRNCQLKKLTPQNIVI